MEVEWHKLVIVVFGQGKGVGLGVLATKGLRTLENEGYPGSGSSPIPPTAQYKDAANVIVVL